MGNLCEKRLIDNEMHISLNVNNSVHMEETAHRKKQVLNGVLSYSNLCL
jgi:hypothetical protein